MIKALTVIYCDDIRPEVGNKVSLMGVYGSDLIVPAFPVVLPKLCMYAQLSNDIGKIFEGELVIRVLQDDDVLFEQAAPSGDLKVISSDAFERRVIQFAFSPFELTKECKLRVRAYFDGEEVKGNALRVRSIEPAQNVDQAATRAT